MKLQALAFALGVLSEAHLIARDDKSTSELGKVVSIESLSHSGHECAGWKVSAVDPGDKLHYPTFKPACKEWIPHKDIQARAYTLSTVKAESGCRQWQTKAEGSNVAVVCGAGTGPNDPIVGVVLPVVPRSKKAAPKPLPKGLLKEVQLSVHTLQSQLARVQTKHQSHLAKVNVHGKKKVTSQELDNGILQGLQKTVHSIQSQLAKAKYSIHSLVSKRDAKKAKHSDPDQGVLKELQKTVKSLQSQITKARKGLHARTSKSVAFSKKLASSGLDQGVLQELQETAKILEDQLAKARKSLRAHVHQRDVGSMVDDDGDVVL